MRKQSNIADIHQHITNQIITFIEKEPGKFYLPWHSGGSIICPSNVASRKTYRGINIVALWAASEMRGYTSGIWGTYRQWTEAGAQVRKGEKSSHVIFYKEIARPNERDEEERSTRLFAKATPVFAAEQVDGCKLFAHEKSSFDPIEAVELFVKATGAKIEHGGSAAYYRPSTDIIRLPLREDFTGSQTITAQEAYYATLLHELTHWTSQKGRCGRQLGKRFGDNAYAMEELVAELGAAFLCAELEITLEPRKDHAQYIASWLKVMKADKKAIFAAASAASKAADYLRSL